MKLNWNFLGGEGAKQKPSMGGVKIFSRTTHYICHQHSKYRESCWLSSIMCRWP